MIKTDANKDKGLYQKFRVERTDGSSAPGGKHEKCRYFVLDLEHDKHAPAALRTYAHHCVTDHPQLAHDLLDLVQFIEQERAVNRGLSMTAQETLDRATAPRVGDVFEWNGNRLTVKCVSVYGVVGTLLECENWYSDAVHTMSHWRESIKRTLAHDGVTFTPALDNSAPPVVQCATK